MSEIDMGAKPFFLDGEAQRWVLDILNSMSLEQKCGQVFCRWDLAVIRKPCVI